MVSSSEGDGWGEVSAAPVGWRDRRFVVAIWVDIYRSVESEERGFIYQLTKKCR